MTRVLHIFTQPREEVAEEILSEQRQNADVTLEVVELKGTTPDYHRLVETVFAADSITVW